MFQVLWEPNCVRHFRRHDPPPFIAPSKASLSSGSGGSSGGWGIAADASWVDVERMLTAYYSHCVQVSGVMGNAHNSWELWADRHGASHPSCQELAAL